MFVGVWKMVKTLTHILHIYTFIFNFAAEIKKIVFIFTLFPNTSRVVFRR